MDDETLKDLPPSVTASYEEAKMRSTCNSMSQQTDNHQMEQSSSTAVFTASKYFDKNCNSITDIKKYSILQYSKYAARR